MPRHKIIAAGIGSVGLALLLSFQSWHDVLGISLAHAQPVSIPDTAISTFTLFVGTAITVLEVLMWMVFLLLDKIMNPVFIFEAQTGVGSSLTPVLQSIWQLSRDLVNIGIAFALIFMAITMIVTADTSKIKEHLPKFVMVIVLVNLSWFIPRALFDLSQILTHVVYRIPEYITPTGAQCNTPGTVAGGPQEPCRIVVNVKFLEETVLINPNVSPTNGWECPIRGIICIQMIDLNSAPNTVTTQSKVLNGLIVNHARMRMLANPSVGAGTNAGLSDVLAYLVRSAILLLLHIAIFFPLLAMTAAFFIRIPVLWVTMAFMPLSALSFVVKADILGEMDPWKIFAVEFLKVVFLPVKVAIPFCIGFIMLNAAANMTVPAAFVSLPTFGIVSGVSSLWQFLWMGVAMGIIWKYSFEALKSGGDWVNKFTDNIKGLGESTMQLAYKAPLAAPVIPMPGGGVSAQEVLRGLSPGRRVQDIESGRASPGILDSIRQQREFRQQQTKSGTTTNVSTVQQSVNNKIDAAQQITLAGQFEAGIKTGTLQKVVEDAIKQTRSTRADNMAGITDRDVIRGLVNELQRNNRITEAQAKQIASDSNLANPNFSPPAPANPPPNPS